jgi:hypothetical protein
MQGVLQIPHFSVIHTHPYFGNYQVDVPNLDVVETMCIANATTATDKEIEVTPEMLAAGRYAFSEHDPRFEGDDEAVERIFLAMLKMALTQGIL